MTTCETIPMLPDTHIDQLSEVTGEPLEVGPFHEGRVFVKVMHASGDDGNLSPLSVDIGISPSGYDDWDGHWHVLESMDVCSEGMHSCAIKNFGNWLRLQLSVDRDASEYAVQAWFVGKG